MLRHVLSQVSLNTDRVLATDVQARFLHFLLERQQASVGLHQVGAQADAGHEVCLLGGRVPVGGDYVLEGLLGLGVEGFLQQVHCEENREGVVHVIFHEFLVLGLLTLLDDDH